MAERFLIIADDFTGSNDTGVQLRKRGIVTEVLFAGKRVSSDKSVVIDTESRTVTPEHAEELVRHAVAEVDFSEFKYVMKKIDSSVRGNLVPEIRAVTEAFRPDLVVCAPALPVMGRTTVGGVQLLNGVPICQTEIARDPINPVAEDSLVDILGHIYGPDVALKGLDDVRGGNLSLTDGVYVCDAETNEDLDRIVDAALTCGKKTLYIGTAGIAESLMDELYPLLPSFGVVASVSSVTNKQMQFCAKNGVTMVKLPVHKLLSGEGSLETYREEALASLKAGKDTILLADTAYDRSTLPISLEVFKSLGYGPIEAGEQVRTMLGTTALDILEHVDVSGVFLSGGDTALGVMKQLDADGSEILAEVLSGIPMVRVRGGRMDGLKLATKAGAYGAENAVLFVMRKMKESL